MSEYHVKQINPNHADHITGYNDKFLLPMFENEVVIAQPKYDGERMLIHIDNGHIYCTSRRFSKKTNRYMENQDKLPILQEKLAHLNLAYTVLDCECYAKDWSTIVGILHSLPERAAELQKQDTARFAIFDCLFYDGKDLRDRPYIERLIAASKVVKMINYEPLHFVKFMNDNFEADESYNCTLIHSHQQWQACMETSVASGFEGIVLKSLQRKYYDKGASLKCKKSETIDTVVIDYKPGTGKYSNTIGALIVGYYDKDTNSFVRLANVNCGTDEDRDMWYKNWSSMQYKVLEVKCQEVTEKSLRHPVYIRIRDDKDYTMCTKDTIFKEI